MSVVRHLDHLRGRTLRFAVTGALVGIGAATLGCAPAHTNTGPQVVPPSADDGSAPETTPTTPVADTSEPETKPDPDVDPDLDPQTNTGPQQKPKVIVNPGPQQPPPPKG